ncbi:MAG: CidA/LrgA family protein [Burkholderiales bacterium]|nr:MAG: CidA/LrgA family protein [Burkholderiales bacterium]
MISGLLQLLVFQGIGELLARFVLPVVPGPVIGLVALLVWLRLRGRVGEGLEQVSGAFSRHLGLLFVPAAVGVVMFVPQLRESLPGLLAALVTSVVATIAVSAWLLKVLSPRDDSDDGGDDPGGLGATRAAPAASATPAAPPTAPPR